MTLRPTRYTSAVRRIVRRWHTSNRPVGRRVDVAHVVFEVDQRTHPAVDGRSGQESGDGIPLGRFPREADADVDGLDSASVSFVCEEHSAVQSARAEHGRSAFLTLFQRFDYHRVLIVFLDPIDRFLVNR